MNTQRNKRALRLCCARATLKRWVNDLDIERGLDVIRVSEAELRHMRDMLAFMEEL
jgi:hypothetical protein